MTRFLCDTWLKKSVFFFNCNSSSTFFCRVHREPFYYFVVVVLFRIFQSAPDALIRIIIRLVKLAENNTPSKTRPDATSKL